MSFFYCALNYKIISLFVITKNAKLQHTTLADLWASEEILTFLGEMPFLL
jgi:hypothetical protein